MENRANADNVSKNNDHQEVEALIDASRLLDDNLMTLVFDGNIEAAQLVLNVLLARTDLTVKSVTVQKVEKSPLSGGRDVWVDILAEDADGNRYDLEIQRSDEGAGFGRARFLSAALDHGMLKKSEKFVKIRDSYVIFITENDVLRGNLPLYHIERTIVELKKKANDGNHILYANGAYHDNATAVGKLMHDFRCRNSEDMFYGPLRDAVHHFKETDEGRERMSKDIEKYGDERESKGKAEGRVEGREEHARETAEKLAGKDMTVADIAESVGYSTEKVREWLGIKTA